MVRTVLIAMMSVALLTVVLFSCSDDKNEPQEPAPEVVVTDVFELDKAAGSITQEEFESKVMNKVWYYPDGSDNKVWVDKDGNEYDWLEYALTGWWYEQAYYFDKDKYVDFRMQPSSGQGPVIPYRQVHREYNYDPATGMVYAPNGFAFQDDVSKHVLFYIESVNEDEMVIHDRYTNPPHFQGDSDAEYTLRSRCVLKAAKGNEAKANWWNKYIIVEED